MEIIYWFELITLIAAIRAWFDLSSPSGLHSSVDEANGKDYLSVVDGWL